MLKSTGGVSLGQEAVDRRKTCVVSDCVTCMTDVDVGIHGNSPVSNSRVPAVGPPHIYAHVTNQQRPSSQDARHVTFADDSSLVVGGPNPCNSSRYGSSELSDVTSITSGSYYIGEDSHHHQQPVSFLFV